jgi:hypothetical protein
METPKISFVVPTRNRVQWLPECLSGLLMQVIDGKPAGDAVEVIVVHDRGGVEMTEPRISWPGTRPRIRASR